MSPRRKKRIGDDGNNNAMTTAALVTPATIEKRRTAGRLKEADHDDDNDSTKPSPRRISPRRVLFGDDTTGTSVNNEVRNSISATANATVIPATSSSLVSKKRKVSPDEEEDYEHDISTLKIQPTAKRRLLFGRYVDLIQCNPNVENVYKIIRKLTGHIGGNGYSGPIYGELTMHSMQKMINSMIETTNLNSASRFLDVGSGIGKPNLHVAQNPGVAFSCGVEMEHTRWALGMTCLYGCLHAAMKQQEQNNSSNLVNDTTTTIRGNTMFLHHNILEASTFNGFTHVYMFSIGFPPSLWHQLSDRWNKSDTNTCRYLICYHGPKDIIDCYEFNVELLTQTSTSMHGSKEGHMGYIYRRAAAAKGKGNKKQIVRMTPVPCDPLFDSAFRLVQAGLEPLYDEVNRQVRQLMGGTGRTTRSRQQQQLTRY